MEDKRKIESPPSPLGSIFSINISVKDIRKNTIWVMELI
jgi:hypothetical protein